MAENKKSEFVVTDKRKFTSEGERRDDEQAQERQEPPPVEAVAPPPPAEPQPEGKERPDAPPPPTAQEQQAGKDAYDESRKKFSPSPLSGRPQQEFEMNFERLVSSLYMSGAMALGGMQEEG